MSTSETAGELRITKASWDGKTLVIMDQAALRAILARAVPVTPDGSRALELAAEAFATDDAGEVMQVVISDLGEVTCTSMDTMDPAGTAAWMQALGEARGITDAVIGEEGISWWRRMEVISGPLPGSSRFAPVSPYA
jgi:hypothetical protein